MPYHVVEFGDYFLYYLFLILYVQELVSAKATTKVSNDDEISSIISLFMVIFLLLSGQYLSRFIIIGLTVVQYPFFMKIT